MNNKGQTGGLITGLVFGVASLVIAVIIAFVIVSTLTGADLLTDGRGSESVINESGWMNGTGYTLTHYADGEAIKSTFTIVEVSNITGAYVATNYTLTGGVLFNTTAFVVDVCNVSYTYDTYSDEETSQRALTNNFTLGVDNVSTKIPTVLLVAAIILILGVLVLLVGAWQRMNIGGGSI